MGMIAIAIGVHAKSATGHVSERIDKSEGSGACCPKATPNKFLYQRPFRPLLSAKYAGAAQAQPPGEKMGEGDCRGKGSRRTTSQGGSPSCFELRYFSSRTTGPDTGSVTPRSPPRSSSVSRNKFRVAIIFGRAAAKSAMSVHSAMML
jgi:hypothetical protein